MDASQKKSLTRDSDRKKLQRLYRELTRELERKTRSRLGDPNPDIREYAHALKRDLRSFPRDAEAIQKRSFSRKSLLQTLLQNEIVLVGDFHPHPQTQREFLRLAREIHPALEGRRLVLGLEFVSTENQPLLDQFMKGELTEHRLLHSLQFEEKWGISHESFRNLLVFARELENTELLALNAPEELQRRRPTEMSDLEYRDRWCAGVLLERLHERRPEDCGRNPLILGLYGELHLASSHLPRAVDTLRRQLKAPPCGLIVLHQNLEPLFWKLMDARCEHDTSLVLLKKTKPLTYCVFSSPPWTRLQSVLDWLETASETEWFDDEIDLLGRFEQTYRFLEQALSLTEDDLSRVDVYSSESLQTVVQKLEKAPLSSNEKRWHQYRLRKGEKLFIPQTGLIFIPDPISPHRFAEVCGERIFQQIHPWLSSLDSPENLRARTLQAWRCLEASFAFFCSKLTNPKRKCDLVSDHLRKSQALAEGLLQPQFDGELQLRLKVLDVLKGDRRIESGLHRSPSSLRERYLLSRYCSWIGKALGEGSYRAMARGHQSLEAVLEVHLKARDPFQALHALHEISKLESTIQP